MSPNAACGLLMKRAVRGVCASRRTVEVEMDPYLGSQSFLKFRVGDQSPADGGEGKAAASSALQNCSGSCSGSTHLRGIAPDALSTFKRNQALRLLEASPKFRGPFYGTPELLISGSAVRSRRGPLGKAPDLSGAFLVVGQSYCSSGLFCLDDAGIGRRQLSASKVPEEDRPMSHRPHWK